MAIEFVARPGPALLLKEFAQGQVKRRQPDQCQANNREGQANPGQARYRNDSCQEGRDYQQPGLCFEAVHRIDVAGEGVRATLEFIVTGPLAWADQFIPRDGERGPEAGRRDGLITGPRAGDCAAQRAAPRTTR